MYLFGIIELFICKNIAFWQYNKNGNVPIGKWKWKQMIWAYDGAQFKQKYYFQIQGLIEGWGYQIRTASPMKL